MTRTVLTFGLIAGIIIVALWHITKPLWMASEGIPNMSIGMLMGYLGMLLGLSMTFFAVRQYRDQKLGGKITFGKALWVGFLVAVIASVIYTAGWMIYYANAEFAQTFSEQYLAYMKNQWTEKGMSAEEIAENIVRYEENMALYDNNAIVRAGMTMMEILPVGILVSVITAFLLRRK